MSFLDDYSTYTESLEVPEIFNLWCSMAALSAVAGRKVWLDLGMMKVAPNLYVVLNSAPGKCGKDTAMNLVRDMLASTPNVFTKSDSITKEKIFEYMESIIKTHPVNNSELKHIIHCSVTIFATEMSLLIKKNDKDFVSALCALFNTIPVLKHSTKTRGENIIINPYLCILGGTTPDWISANVQEDVIEGGLTARTMLIYSDTPRPPNPDPLVIPRIARLGIPDSQIWYPG